MLKALALPSIAYVFQENDDASEAAYPELSSCNDEHELTLNLSRRGCTQSIPQYPDPESPVSSESDIFRQRIKVIEASFIKLSNDLNSPALHGCVSYFKANLEWWLKVSEHYHIILNLVDSIYPVSTNTPLKFYEDFSREYSKAIKYKDRSTKEFEKLSPFGNGMSILNLRSYGFLTRSF